jgi:integrase
MASVFRRSGTWYVRWRTREGWKQRATTARNHTEAKGVAAELELEERALRRAALRDVTGLPPAQEDLPGTIADLCRWRLKERCSTVSRAIETARLEKHVLRAPFGALSLTRMRSSDLDNFLHGLRNQGSAPATANKLRAILHSVFSRARRAGKWVGENPVAATAPFPVPKRAYVTLTPDQLGRMLEQVPDDWRPLFACGPALGLRKGELFALRKADVDRERWTLTVARSHERETTKGGVAAVLPIPEALRPWIVHQLERAPGALLFPALNGFQRPREADPQKILRTALARAGITAGYEHRCRWCGHKEQHQDNEQRYCPKCLKRTDGRGHALRHPRGRALWPKALHLPMRFHDLRHTFATELLRRGVDVHRVQRLMRHSDVRVTTGTYAHLLVEDLRAAVDAHAPVPLAPPPVRDLNCSQIANRPSAAANLLHGPGSRNDATSNSPGKHADISDEDGGRCRIRTCDPCRVKAVLYR